MKCFIYLPQKQCQQDNAKLFTFIFFYKAINNALPETLVSTV